MILMFWLKFLVDSDDPLVWNGYGLKFSKGRVASLKYGQCSILLLQFYVLT